jgi:hypothetical protein
MLSFSFQAFRNGAAFLAAILPLSPYCEAAAWDATLRHEIA